MKIESKIDDQGKLVFSNCVASVESTQVSEVTFDSFKDLKQHLESRIQAAQARLHASVQSYKDLLRAFDNLGNQIEVPAFSKPQDELLVRAQLETDVRLVLDVSFDEQDRMALIGARVRVPELTDEQGVVCQDPAQLGLLFRTIKRHGIASQVEDFVKNIRREKDFSEALEYADTRLKHAAELGQTWELENFSHSLKQLEQENPARAVRLKDQRANISAGMTPFRRRASKLEQEEEKEDMAKVYKSESLDPAFDNPSTEQLEEIFGRDTADFSDVSSEPEVLSDQTKARQARAQQARDSSDTNRFRIKRADEAVKNKGSLFKDFIIDTAAATAAASISSLVGSSANETVQVERSETA